MLEDLESKLKGFERVWRRVAEEKTAKAGTELSLMPRKKQKPRRRFEPHI